MKLYVVMDDGNQELYPVEADSPEQAREVAHATFGVDATNPPVCDCTNDDSVLAMLDGIEAALSTKQ